MPNARHIVDVLHQLDQTDRPLIRVCTALMPDLFPAANLVD